MTQIRTAALTIASERIVVEMELPPQHAQRQAAVLFQVAPHLADDAEQVHRDGSVNGGAIWEMATSLLAMPKPRFILSRAIARIISA